jgi:hypothetical protein
VNNVSDPASFFIHFPPEIFIHIPGIFIQNLSERPIHIARNPHRGLGIEGPILHRKVATFFRRLRSEKMAPAGQL